MLIKKSRFFILTFQINSFRIPLLVLPLRCVHEIAEGLMDILCLFQFASKSVIVWADLAQNFILELQNYGRLDLIDIDVKSDSERIRIGIFTR